MNVLITLPKELINKILSGEKKFEMRKSILKLMKIGEDGFFVVEKGTDEVRCWCRVDAVTMPAVTEDFAEKYAKELFNIFPELAESEDERIRKSLIDMLKNDEKCYLKEIAWLEKQGEQKPSQEIVPFEAEHGKYYYCIKDYFCGGRKQASKGDVVQALRGLPIMGLKDASGYFLPVNFIKCNSAWSEEDEMFVHGLIRGLSAKRDIHGHTTFSSDCIDITETINWLKSLKDRVQPKQEWSEEDEATLDTVTSYLKIVISDVHFAYVFDWLKSLKYRILPKQEWSEEDESNISELCSFITESYSKEDASGLRQWLKSLRPQNRWKPSEYHLKSLQAAIGIVGELTLTGTDLKELLEQLKKLREE